ncbi:hypothetical protein [uncultured Pseudomonas sp.]|uniref:hypothetical protein n=1 Tax=uncultured Pseudomonas sp. TaxID=114707 RepID=UPI0025912B99|nr:hypothetical protein [uncultured Pseudomonas sp.]
MNHNFKPGDLALVVGGTCLLGYQVQLAVWVNPGETVTIAGHDFRLSSHVKRGGWVIELDSAVVVKLPENLMPLQHDFSFERHQAVEVAA